MSTFTELSTVDSVKNVNDHNSKHVLNKVLPKIGKKSTLKNYQITNSSDDGWCFLYSYITSYNSQMSSNENISIYDVNRAIRLEVSKNTYTYTRSLTGDDRYSKLNMELNDYLISKSVCSSTADLIPVIISNAFNTNIGVLICDASCFWGESGTSGAEIRMGGTVTDDSNESTRGAGFFPDSIMGRVPIGYFIRPRSRTNFTIFLYKKGCHYKGLKYVSNDVYTDQNVPAMYIPCDFRESNVIPADVNDISLNLNSTYLHDSSYVNQHNSNCNVAHRDENRDKTSRKHRISYSQCVTAAEFNYASLENENLLKRELENGQFWKYFSIFKSKGDGHCLVYSTINSLKS